MSISPASDLILDVVRAADPASVNAASERLAAGAPLHAAPPVAAAEAFQAQFDRAASSIPAQTAGHPATKSAGAYRKFEAMVLQSFIKDMLPRDGQDVYGQGTAGDIWKSMLAQQIATVVSRRGGIGIADHLLAGRFSGLGLEGVPQAKLSGDNLNISRGLVHQLQMSTINEVRPLGNDDTGNDGII